MKASRTLLLVCGVCLALSALALPYSYDAGFLASSVSLSMSRGSLSRGRSLLEDINEYALSPTTQYLIPTFEAPLCSGNGCCQQDDYASPFRIRMQNSSTSQIGGRSYTTFFMTLRHNGMCSTVADEAGCCNGTVSSMWIDVDPALFVRAVTFDSKPTGIVAEQSESGLSISGFNVAQKDFTSAGFSITVTVEGVVKQLCPLSDLAPVGGYCGIILVGDSASGATDACCPRGLSQMPPAHDVFLPPSDGGFQCSSDIEQSGYKLALQSVGTPYYEDDQAYVKYDFLLSGSSSCDSNAVGACCSMELDGLELRVTTAASIAGVEVGSKVQPFTTSPWSEPGLTNDYQALLVNNLGIAPMDVPLSGLMVSITAALNGSYAPDICTISNANSSGNVGRCEYFLYSAADSTCCPASTTVAVPPPAPICNPTMDVPMADTSATLQYYEHTYATDATKTYFTFLVTDHNANPASCGKAHCGDVCGWSLFVKPSAQETIAVTADNMEPVAGPYQFTQAPNATVTFNYGPAGESTVTYTLSMSGRRSLSDLCEPNAWPGQGSKPCAAILRTADVYSVVFFSESDLALPSYPPPPLPKDLCDGTPLPLSSACTRVDSAGYNSPADSSSTVFDFKVVNHEDEAAPCLADSAVSSPTFTVLLQPAVAAALASSNKLVLQPNTAILDATNGGVRWSWTPTSQSGSNIMHYSFNVPMGGLTMATACQQGVFFDQPFGSCVVQISGAQHCFRGYISAPRAPDLVWLNAPAPKSASSKSGAIIGGTIGGFFGLLAIIAVIGLAVFIVRRRRSHRAMAFNNLGTAQSSNGSGNDLQRPLASNGGGVVAGAASSSGSASGGGLATQSRGLAGSFTAGPAVVVSGGSRGQSFCMLGGAITVANHSSSSTSEDNLSTVSATPSDIAIQVRRGTLSDAGAPLQPIAPEDVLMRMRNGASSSMAQEPQASHYGLHDGGSLI